MSSWSLRTSLLFAIFASCPAFAQHYSDQYALILDDEPVVARFQGRDAPRSAAAQSYRRQIAAAQQSVRTAARVRRATVTGSADTVLNAVFVQAAPGQLSALGAIPGVKAVIRMRTALPYLNRAATLMNAPAAWTALGGQSSAGAGIKIGIIDSGIDQTHPAFQDASLKAPAGFPICTDGHPEDCAYTSAKVIVARSYVRQIAPGSDPANPAADSRPDDFSPRDRVGHGTAVASAAAANLTTAPVTATGGGAVTITGIAPKAYLGNYKIYGSPGVNDNAPESVFIAAINDAVKDGMDVVNVSSGFAAIYAPLDTGVACGLPPGTPCDPLATAYENAVKAGVVVVAAAGNSGQYVNDGSMLRYPAFNTIGSPSDAPGVIAVGASSNSHYFDESVSVAGAPANLQNIVASYGDNYTSTPFGAGSAPIIDVSPLTSDGLACTALPAGSLQGSFALIRRAAPCSASTQEGNALDAGAAGLIFYMTNSAAVSPVSGMNGDEPVAVISSASGEAIRTWLATNPGAVGIIDPSGIEVDDSLYKDQLASFSSLGPAIDGSLKPDLVAAGSSSSAYSGLLLATQDYDLNSELFSATRYMGASGTSFSAPLVAGAAALVRQKHPGWSPAQVKAALLNSASQAVTLNDGLGYMSGTPALIDTQWAGAGRLDVGASVNDSVLAIPSTLSYGYLSLAPNNISKSITVTNTGAAAVTLSASVAQSSRSSSGNLSAGLIPTADKTSLALAAGASGAITLTLNGPLPAPGSYSGALTLTAPGFSLRVPYVYSIPSGIAYNIWALPSNVEGVTGHAIVNDLSIASPGPNSTIGILLTDAAGAPVVNAPVSWTVTRSAVTFSNAAATTNALGIATADVTIARTGSFDINVTAGGLSVRFDHTLNCLCYGRVQPTIATGGVVSSGNAQSVIAPGSYVTLYGTGLSDPGNTDSAAYTPLPLVIDGVAVSFDVPSAKLSYPARMVFVSPRQVNIQVPWELQGQTSAQMKVILYGDSYGNVVTVPLAAASPEFFVDASTGIVAARNLAGGQIFTASPAARGQIVSLFLNGMGPVDNQPASGEVAGTNPLATTKSTPMVTIGGQNAVVQFSGLAPGFPGLYQINATVPAGLAAGNQPISVSIGGKTTPAKVADANGATIVLPVQ